MAKRKKKPKVVKELTEEEIALAAQKRKYRKRKGIWEVTLDDGIIIGLFEGTPEKIGAYVVANQDRRPNSLFFQLVKVREVPETILRDRCCEKKFGKRDNFCSLCGKAKVVDPKAPMDVEIDIDLI